MNILDIIIKKRDKEVLTNEEIRFFINGVCDGSIPDYQISSLLMAIVLNGLNKEETAALTLEMAYSGDMFDLSSIDGVKVDKHSTGGVADTTTLVLAPLIAACGIPVIKMSGRGLGHTGGTIDKMESIPNLKTELTTDMALEIAKKTNIVVMAQTGNITPADKKLYALRDVTGTVDSIPLIAGSIMSKKIAAGASCIVLDVKCGSGAFMKDFESAKQLANVMVEIGKSVNRNVCAVISNMTEPLGTHIGNALEVIEAIEVLKGNVKGDLTDVSILLGAYMLMLAGIVKTEEEGKAMLIEKIKNGDGLKKFAEFISSQGGDSNIINDYKLFFNPKEKLMLISDSDGYIYEMNAAKIGRASVETGAGRLSKSDIIDYESGIIMHKRIGDAVKSGEIIATLYANEKNKLIRAEQMLKEAIIIQNEKPAKEKLILDIIMN